MRRLDLKEVEDAGEEEPARSSCNSPERTGGRPGMEGVLAMRLVEGLLIHRGGIYSDCFG